IPRVP
ncbi:carbohydrate phosphorylase family protein, partial [Vibrio parahaemolyticus V-223/04]